ncbi:hypothetical protein A8950_3094 [Dongia mobilis]|uniref:DUF2946 family protein n=1 Tax=Dongia mobilis TaxID=578943 RepID=A0A4V3DEB1_9PROT|nr:hypothetical protein [Dongia mobilis]TDQ80561.1 hypothetical protein A8950_3094 [Dongia mobilis]
MFRATLFKAMRRRSFWPALILGYVLLFQAILGSAAASAHAFAMAQQDALGIAMLCIEDGVDGRLPADPATQAPAGDCINCKIACAAGIALPAVTPPELAALFLIARVEAHHHAINADAALPRAALFDSDLPSQAPPAGI